MPDLEQQLRAAQTRHASEPENCAILHQICELLVALQREEEMLLWADRALAINPHDSASITRRADSLYLLGRYAEAVATWERDPLQQSKPILHRLRLGMSLMMAGDLVDAITLLNQAWQMAGSINAEISASVGFALGEAMLKAGDPHGFTYWLMRNDAPRLSFSYRPIDIPVWDGESDLCGKRVLITHELGFGDNFLLGACIADWVDAGASVMFTSNPESHALMQTSLPHCEVISAPNPAQLYAALPDELQPHVNRFAPHLHATLLHLPLVKAKQETVSGQWFRPYIQAPPQKDLIAKNWASQLRSQHTGKNLVGLFWDCAQRHWPETGAIVRCWAKRRSLPLNVVNSIVQYLPVADRVHFVNLHHPAVATLAGDPVDNVSSYLPGIRNFGDTAACIAQLDAVVAVDSGVANLAAMMGVPTCVLTHTSGDWRWGIEGNASPWIKNATVFRQTNEGDWTSVVQGVRLWLAHDIG